MSNADWPLYVIASLVGIMFALIVVVWRTKVDSNDLIRDILSRHDSDKLHWDTERQKLLDRIQAPSFEHLKHAEVKILKAQSGEKEPPKPVME